RGLWEPLSRWPPQGDVVLAHGRKQGADPGHQSPLRHDPLGYGDLLQGLQNRGDQADLDSFTSLRGRTRTYRKDSQARHPNLRSANWLQRSRVRGGQEDHLEGWLHRSLDTGQIPVCRLTLEFSLSPGPQPKACLKNRGEVPRWRHESLPFVKSLL